MFPNWYDKEPGKKHRAKRSHSTLRDQSLCVSEMSHINRGSSSAFNGLDSSNPPITPPARQTAWSFTQQPNQPSSVVTAWDASCREKPRPITAHTDRINLRLKVHNTRTNSATLTRDHPSVLIKSLSQTNGISMQSYTEGAHDNKYSSSSRKDNEKKLVKKSHSSHSFLGGRRTFSSLQLGTPRAAQYGQVQRQGEHERGHKERDGDLQDSTVLDDKVLDEISPRRHYSSQTSWDEHRSSRSQKERRRSSSSFRRRSSAIDRVLADVPDSPEGTSYQRFFIRRRMSQIKSMDNIPVSSDLRVFSSQPDRGLERFRRLVKAIRVITGVCWALKSYVRKTVTTNWSFVEFYLHLEKDISPTLAFDPQQFRKIEPPKGGRKLERLLSIPSKQRTPADIQKILAFVRTHDSFSKFPANIQVKLCQVMQYQSYDPRTVIIKQGHIPSAFYLILSGSLIVNVQQVNPVSGTAFVETVAYVGRGECFGEIALLENNPRSATLVCKSRSELLVVYKEDFGHLILEPLLRQRDDDIDYCLSHSLFEEFPRELFEANPDHYFYQYFPAESVIVSDSTACPFLILVKSGECQVVGSFEKDEDEKCKQLRHQTLEHIFPLHDLMKKVSPEKMQDLTAQFDTMIASVLMQRRKVGYFFKHNRKENVSNCKTAYLRLEESKMNGYEDDGKGDDAYIDPKDYLKDILDENSNTEKTFVQVAILPSGSVYGLETLTTASCSPLSVVSQGVECIMVSKQFFLQHANIKSLRVAGDLVTQYPSSSVLRGKLKTCRRWTEYKQELVNRAV